MDEFGGGSEVGATGDGSLDKVGGKGGIQGRRQPLSKGAVAAIQGRPSTDVLPSSAAHEAKEVAPVSAPAAETSGGGAVGQTMTVLEKAAQPPVSAGLTRRSIRSIQGLGG